MLMILVRLESTTKRGASLPSIANTEVKRRSSSMPNWGQLLSDVLLPILNRQSFVDVQRVKTVCLHWNSVAKQLKLYTKFHGIPCLLIPPRDEEGNANSKTSTRKHIKSNCYSVLKKDRFIVPSMLRRRRFAIRVLVLDHLLDI
jgi:hypothetical protein